MSALLENLADDTSLAGHQTSPGLSITARGYRRTLQSIYSRNISKILTLYTMHHPYEKYKYKHNCCLFSILMYTVS